MFFNKSLLAVAAVLIGSASAFTGTRSLRRVRPLGPRRREALLRRHRHCVLGAGTENIELGDSAFAMLEDNFSQTILFAVTWAFD
ncbi:hypothetical protein B0H14DRAFT_2892460 [Mycena olivaceomarginata]|nr:hypothetical protein B0H14DRAFT_2892460 [Mycena olivaceomarginata]